MNKKIEYVITTTKNAIFTSYLYSSFIFNLKKNDLIKKEG